jgi:tetratricopeptide (TPR) repeat protein
MLAGDGVRLGKVRYWLERGRTYNSSDEQATALPLFHQAFELANALGENRYAVDALHMIAIAEKDPTVQLEWNLKAIAHAEATNEKGWLFALYNNIGESYLSLQLYEEAYEYFSRLARLQIERTGTEDQYTLKDKAKAARLAGRADESVELMMPVLDKLLSTGSDDGYIRQEYGEALHALGDVGGAKPHFAKAYELLSQDAWVAEYEPQSLERLRTLSA